MRGAIPGMFAVLAAVAAGPALLACGDGLAMAPDGGPDSGIAGQGSPARGDLVINEVAPQPASGPDSIELYNRSDGAVDLCDYFVTDDLDRLDHYARLAPASPPDTCQPALLGAGEIIVIVADDDPDAGPDHAPFRLGIDDQVHVVTAAGIAADSFIYLYACGVGCPAGASLARIPNGQGLFYPVAPSLGAANPEVVP